MPHPVYTETEIKGRVFQSIWYHFIWGKVIFLEIWRCQILRIRGILGQFKTYSISLPKRFLTTVSDIFFLSRIELSRWSFWFGTQNCIRFVIFLLTPNLWVTIITDRSKVFCCVYNVEIITETHVDVNRYITKIIMKKKTEVKQTFLLINVILFY
jgi:hypothetical protein